MASGRQIGEQNASTFVVWAASKTDEDFGAMVRRGVLSRKAIAIECSFAKSALEQNPRIKAALRKLEEALRLRGVLPPAVERDDSRELDTVVVRGRVSVRGTHDAERITRLEHENACLRIEVGELKRSLKKYRVLQDALMLTGRVPR